MSWLDPIFQGISNIMQAGASIASRRSLNFVSGASVADNPTQGRVDVTITAGVPAGATNQLQTNAGAGAFGFAPIAFSGTTLTDTRDAKVTDAVQITHVSTASTSLTTIYTLALAGITGSALVRALVSVTDSTGANVAWYQVDAGYKLAAGTPTNVYGATATNLGKAGTLAGTEVTLAISTTNVLVQVTAPSASALTWQIHGFSHVAIA